MARFRQVTRTVEYTIADIMAVNTDTKEVTTESVTLSGTFDTNEKLLKEAQSLLPENLKGVSVENAEVQEKTFCMPESRFIQDAMALPVGKKALTKKDFEEYYAEQYDGTEEVTE
jgi:hypothetical protein